MAPLSFPARGILALLASAFSISVPAAASDAVISLHPKNFASEIQKHDLIAVEFYAEWCQACRNLAPMWHKAADILAERGIPAKLAEFDAVAEPNRPISEKYEIRSFPTMKIFKKGDLDDPLVWRGSLFEEGIVEYMTKLTMPALSPVSSASELEEMVPKDLVVVVGVFKSLDSAEFESFSKVADKLVAEFPFRYTTDLSLLPSGYPSPPKAPFVRMLKEFDEYYTDIKDFDVSTLREKIEAAASPYLAAEPRTRYMKLGGQRRTNNTAFLLLAKDDPNFETMRSIYLSFAKRNAATVGCQISQPGMKESENIPKLFAFTMDDAPFVGILSGEKGRFGRKKVGPNELTDFLNKFQAGKEARIWRSGPLPAPSDEPLKDVVYLNFKELVLDSKNDVLITLYNSYESDLNAVTGVLLQVAEELEDEPGLTVARIDFMSNDIPLDEMKVKQPPTTFFYSRKKKLVPYDGKHTKKGLIAFIDKQRGMRRKDEL